MTAGVISAVYTLFFSFIFCTYFILFACISFNNNRMHPWLILYSNIIFGPLNWIKNINPLEAFNGKKNGRNLKKNNQGADRQTQVRCYVCRTEQCSSVTVWIIRMKKKLATQPLHHYKHLERGQTHEASQALEGTN